MSRWLTIVFLLLVHVARGANDVTSFGSMTLASTFHCISVKVEMAGDDNSNATCVVQFRTGGGAWRNGYALWRDTWRQQFKGSMVYVLPNTTYEVRVQVSDTDGVPAVAAITNSIATWSETFTEESANSLSNITVPITITSGGSSLGNYRRYGPTFPNRWTVNVGTSQPIAMTIQTTNIIIQNMDFVSGGNSNALRVLDGMSNIVIQNCTFANYGPFGKGNGPLTELVPDPFPDEDRNAAICLGRNSVDSGVGRVVVQNCDFGPANGGSNSWDPAPGNNNHHPVGPHGVYVSNSRGSIVIRYNRFRGDPGAAYAHWYNDAIGGNSNSTTNGFVRRDSDIYGNIISEVWDDGIEVEGGNENVRVFCNVITNVHVAIASAATMVGPLYKWRNTHFFNRQSESNAALREVAFKGGAPAGKTNLAEFYFFNTVCDPERAAGLVHDSGGLFYMTHTRNNIGQTSGKVINDTQSAATSSYDWDFFKPGYTITVPVGSEANAITNTPTFSPVLNHELYLAAESPGYRAGTAINNFSDDSNGNNLADPNMGAWDQRFPVYQIGPLTNTVPANAPRSGSVRNIRL